MAAVEPHVAIIQWPDQIELRRALRALAMPRLLVVRDGAPPSDLDALEDWVSEVTPAAEVEARVSSLAARAHRSDLPTPTLDDDDVLRVGDRWVALGPVEARLARALVDNLGALVPRATLEARAWPGEPVRANTVDRQLHRLRRHLAHLGLTLVTIRGRGYVLETAPARS